MIARTLGGEKCERRKRRTLGEGLWGCAEDAEWGEASAGAFGENAKRRTVRESHWGRVKGTGY
jgi:hypothetical protein